MDNNTLLTTIGQLCRFYGVPVEDFTDDPDEEAILYRDEKGGWHIRGWREDCDWAPQSDKIAEEILSEGYAVSRP
jgi:hypothetical protein